MKDTVIAICNRIIEYSFYSIFLFVPLAFTATTSELFEFNKMWLTFGITLVIAASWFSKMVVQKKFFLQKTPLDIPIALFLLAHILSTLFSIDQHISFWGYYTRFNGGLLSMVTYIFLYYAFVSNFFLHIPRSEKDQPMQPPKSVSDQAYRIIVTKHALFISLGSGLIAGLLVALWGFPSHFGYDPTCYLFRGTFDVSCWTDAFQPKVRIFSTLGQPNWMAAYLSILLPLTLSLSILNLESFFKHKEKNYELRITNYEKNKKIILASLFMILASLFYVDILYTKSQSGFLGTLAALGIFSLLYLFVGYIRESMKTKLKILASIVAIYAVLTFVIGHPIPQLDRFT
ncbi:MAG: hypothetical protein KBD46_03715, partial [Candidatus Levybacteria bacterium]|nr:hypothetical protein [Candidatus Levybacteria bacterium]